MRLNRFLASAGLGSRRSVEELVLTGQVRLNGEVVSKLATQVQPGDSVKVGSQLLRSERPLTAVLYKPPGFLCTASDERGRQTIFSLLPRQWPRVFHVGRLDADSEGLLILTNDGDLANALAHPRYKVEKEYEATVDRPFDPRLIPKLLTGVHIEGGRAKAERVTLEGPKHLRIVLTQGINRQIHKMLWRVGEYDVERLARVRIGPIGIEGLHPGGWRLLTGKELAAMRPESKGASVR
ncbi:MAG: pseudouridine synthase [Chthoniobacteraceae bacterium]